MVYTCYEMVRDCREDKPAGWSYLISSYVPVIRRLLAHYAPGQSGGALEERVLRAMRDPRSSLFQSLEPAPERWFLAELRQKVLAEIAFPPPGIELDLDTVAAAFEPLTLTEKQTAWFETMSYDAQTTGAMLRMAPTTVEKIRARAGELLRGASSSWRQSILAENGAALGRAASGSAGGECLSAKVFLDILDGRMTWRGRDEMESHVVGCWHCIDHFCRMMETVELIRGLAPLTEEEAAPLHSLLGIRTERPPLWKRFVGRA